MTCAYNNCIAGPTRPSVMPRDLHNWAKLCLFRHIALSETRGCAGRNDTFVPRLRGKRRLPPLASLQEWHLIPCPSDMQKRELHPRGLALMDVRTRLLAHRRPSQALINIKCSSSRHFDLLLEHYPNPPKSLLSMGERHGRMSSEPTFHELERSTRTDEAMRRHR